MRKFATEPGELQPQARISPRRLWISLLIGLILTPLVFDGTKICLAGWQSLFGPVMAFETPAIDAVMSTFDAVYSAARDRTSEPFHNVPWNPQVVLCVAAVWTVCGYIILMRSR